MKTNKKVTKERRTFKEVVSENKGKIIAITSLIGASIVGVLIYQQNRNFEEECEDRSEDNDTINKNFAVLQDNIRILGDRNSALNIKVKVTQDVINNSGIIDQARATVIRKRDRLESKLNCASEEDTEMNSQLKRGISKYDQMLRNYDVFERTYKERTIGESLIED